MPLKATEEHALTNLPLLDNSEPICTGERSDVCFLIDIHKTPTVTGSQRPLSASASAWFSKVLWKQQQTPRGAASTLPETTAPPLAVVEADAEPVLLSRA